jgi:hypothetical protein
MDRNLIVDSALFFARPSMFNDPLDCRIPPSFEADPADIERFWREKWARQGRPARSQEELDGLIALALGNPHVEVRMASGGELDRRSHELQRNCYHVW